jgi:hypothetical protein
MPSQHKHPPIPFRPPEGDRAWLLQYAKSTGQPVNRILAAALAAYRERLIEAAKLAVMNGGPH